MHKSNCLFRLPATSTLLATAFSIFLPCYQHRALHVHPEASNTIYASNSIRLLHCGRNEKECAMHKSIKLLISSFRQPLHSSLLHLAFFCRVSSIASCMFFVKQTTPSTRNTRCGSHNVEEVKRRIQRPGIEPGTSAVLKPRHNQLDHLCSYAPCYPFLNLKHYIRLECHQNECHHIPYISICTIPEEMERYK
jgi:hypothetical protein